MPVRTAMASAVQPAGPMLLEVQGQADLSLVRALLAKLVRRMAADGREVNTATQADAVGAGCLALTQWRAKGGEGERLATRVAWRAIVAEVSDDTLGDSVPVQTCSEDWLWAHQARGDESRQERAARLWIERAAKGRIVRLRRRLDNLPPGRGKRKELIERIGTAAVFLLQGEHLDDAATLAGFKAGGRACAGDRLIQGIKRLGLVGEGFHIPRKRRA